MHHVNCLQQCLPILTDAYNNNNNYYYYYYNYY